ncbi:hypothetical protein BI049_gp066 [Salmonella phage vB_SnwM_CGG4-1]|uniref:Uncharacterized protein n=1 Tax=Salmonella phage vB_SnwM_CGG4-1 TaxID=1815631 RepID=A0A1B0VV31_9CAUD|nr:hypothetical protein BI049_gp066 [Salmonella phage vB_SnwM_CGG4-1]ANA49420.1 hypothetical protein CGG41_066 [Salmonella phage vB_SnwM_CGG4-1]
MNLTGLKLTVKPEVFKVKHELGDAIDYFKDMGVIRGDELVISKCHTVFTDAGEITGITSVYFTRLNMSLDIEECNKRSKATLGKWALSRWALFTSCHITGNPDCSISLFDTPNTKK